MSLSDKKQLFLLQNQDKYFLSKDSQWVDGRDPKELFKTPHRDIAVNQLFEVNAHDYTQRIQVLVCEVEGRNMPVIDDSLLPAPQPVDSGAESDNQPHEQGTQAETETTHHYEQATSLTSDTAEPEEELLVHEV